MRSSLRHLRVHVPGATRLRATRRELLGLAALGVVAAGTRPARSADSRLIYASHISLAPTWFDPAETPGIVTPFMLLYALHDGLVKPMPGNPAAPCLAESYSASADGLSHSFVLRPGAIFHNGAPVTAEDVKFSFERYRGNAAGFIKEQVAAVETPDPRRVVFRLHRPWPDFLTYYSSVTGAGWIVPKKYVESVGEDGFKKEPIGAGPYKFVSFTPGIELVMEAFDGYWRKVPTVKRLVWKVIQEETTRLAALKRGEVDLAYSIRGELAEELQRTPGLELKPVLINSPFWIYFADQWDPKSPWHDARVRKAATLALDREGINQALTLGHSLLTGSIVPKDFDYYWQPPKIPHDPAMARGLLAEAGFRGGFDAGEYYCDSSYANLGEAALGSLAEVGIRMKLRAIERAAFTKGYSEKKYRNLIQGGSGAFGNAATRMETFVAKGGAYVYGSYPDIDELFAQQTAETDRAKRTVILHRMQQLVHERTVYAPLWQLAFLNGQGPRVDESAFGLISGHPYSAPYEDVRLKGGA
ncbi:peptide/nickel transport system substrate-binding protein [Rhodospirillales bacterium URHD0017]|nr:peptide/nickel transport system substrate-binding protein [Rhodospirillales bacterium URHD0017]